MTGTITSAQNPKIKELVALQQKSSERRKSGLFVLEGARELRHCLSAGFKADSLFICPEIFTGGTEDGSDLLASVPGNRIFEVSRDVYSRIAYRDGTEGVIAEIRARDNSISSLDLPENPLVLVAENVEKPGNIGAMLRTCDAAGVDALMICEPRTDLYNPNLIRASLGAVFTVPCALCSSSEAISFLKRRRLNILTAQLQDSSLYYDCDMRCGTAIVMGTEDVGLSEAWRDAADAHIRIPMLGKLDSLNVSVSAAILLYEAVRQRQERTAHTE